MTVRPQSNRKTPYGFFELSLPQTVAARELSLRTLRDETHALRALVAALIGVVTSGIGSPEYDASLAALVAGRSRG